MSSMGDTATAFRSSSEKTNYAKLCQLIIDGGRLALKAVFDGFHTPANLHTALNNNITTLRRLQRMRVLKADQWDLLFPSSTGAVPDSNNFDITLLYTLLREICGLHPPASGWNSKPPLSDTSLEANIIRIKFFRNELAHKPTTEFDERSFRSHWVELSGILVQLGLNQSSIDNLYRSEPVNEHQYVELLAEWKREEDSIKGQFETVIQNQVDIQEKLDLVQQTQKLQLSKLQYEESDEVLVGDIKYHHNDAYLLGKGSKGTKVYSGILVSSGKKIAVKRIYAELFDEREAVRLKQLTHPNIIQCFAVEKKGDFIYLALELCRKTLKTCIEDNDFGRRESNIERLDCLKDVTRAVVHLHERNICHRDVKPDNILLFNSVPPKFVLADFNTAKESASNESALTQQGCSVVGSFGYMAPEVYHFGKKSRKQDIFSLGCVAYYTLTDKGHPFGSVQHLRKCQEDIDHGKKPSLDDDFLDGAWMKPVIKAMVSPLPEQRPTGEEVLLSLEGKGTVIRIVEQKGESKQRSESLRFSTGKLRTDYPNPLLNIGDKPFGSKEDSGQLRLGTALLQAGGTTARSTSIKPANNTVNDDQDSDHSQLGEYLEEEVPLQEAEWFHGTIDCVEVEDLLKKEGDYLVREIRTKPGQFFLSTRTQGQMRNFVIQNTDGLVKFEDAAFSSLQSLLKHHLDNHIPVTKKSQALLLTPILRPPQDKWDLKHSRIVLVKKLGQGHFADVMKGILKPSNMEVAVKVCRESISNIDKQSFLAGAEMLKKYHHPNIIKLIGVCTDEEPLYIVMELMPGGNLLSYLRKNGAKLKATKLINFSIDAASGMEYLESRNCVHRDLAARNCLIGKDEVLKISNFQMSRELEEGPYKESNTKIPIKWTCPEALIYAQYTTSSDIWSFGVLLWETFSLGTVPYPGFSFKETFEKVADGYRMPPPLGTPPTICTLMKECWHQDPEERPRFSEILPRLKQTGRNNNIAARLQAGGTIASSTPMKPANNTVNNDQDLDDSQLGEYLELLQEEVPLQEAEWFHGTIDGMEVEDLLKKEGDYLVRESRTQPGQFVLSTRTNGQMRNFVIQNTDGVVKFEDAAFSSVQLLLKYHLDNHIPVSRQSQVLLLTPILRAPQDKWDLKHSRIVLDKRLAYGHFGVVMKGILKPSNMEVAVKVCRESISNIDKQSILAGAEMLKKYHHPNIIKLIGVCVDEEPLYTVIELMPGGDLLSYLRKNGAKLKATKLIKFSIDAASGMEYLESRNCVHRYLAARNCLIGKDEVLKISNFQMSRELEEGLYEASNIDVVPLKWACPEAIAGRYATSNDIWGFGILLWEMFSLGDVPYPGFTSEEACEKVAGGYRMPPPLGTPPTICTLMKECWHQDPEERPRFCEILPRLKQTGRNNNIAARLQAGGTIASSTPMKPANNTVSNDQDSDDSQLGEYLELLQEEVPLQEAEWFHGTIDGMEVEDLLKKEGDYLVRESRTQPGQFVLSTRTNGQMRNVVIQNTDGVVKFEDAAFSSVQLLLKYHLDNHIPVSRHSQALLLTPILRPPQDKWGLKHSRIVLDKRLRNGYFGVVMKGILKPSNMEVAVKVCRESISNIDKQSILAGAEMLKKYHHPNIIKLIGVCVDEEPLYTVTELMPGGDLLSYLRKNGAKLKATKLINFSIDAASGMEYLESRNCVHRDLAARNCLIGKDEVLKISNFQMSRELEEGHYKESNMESIPIKWTCPEALIYTQYTISSDIWSFGILLWETFSLGTLPYAEFTNKEAFEKVSGGYRMPPPSGTPPSIYTLMKECWHREPDKRPRFSEILLRLKQVQSVK